MSISIALCILIILVILCNFHNVFNSLKNLSKQIYIWPILLQSVLIQIYLSLFPYLHNWDERYHALVAKNMANDWSVPTLISNPLEGVDVFQWTLANIWLHKQPLTFWIIGSFIWFFGDSVWVVRLPSIILTSCAIWCTFKIGQYLFDKRIGFIAAFLHASNGKIFETAAGKITTDHVDTIFIVLVEFSVLSAILCYRNPNILRASLTGILCGMAVLTKWLTGLLGLPLLFYLILVSQKSLSKAITLTCLAGLTSIVIFSPWQLYIIEYYPLLAEAEYTYNRRHFTEVIEGHSGGYFFYLNNFCKVFGETIIILLVWVIGSKINDKKIEIIFLTLWIFIPLLFFSVAKTKLSGYMMISYPAIFILLALGINEATNRYKNVKKHASVITILIISTSLLFPLARGIERMKLFKNNMEVPAWQNKINKFSAKRKNSVKKALVFNDDKYIQLMYASSMTTAYPLPLDSMTLSRIDTNIYEVFVKNNDGNYVKKR